MNTKSRTKRLSQALKANLRRRKNTQRPRKKDIKLQSIKIILLLILATVQISCNKKTINIGHQLEQSNLQKVEVNNSTKQDVINILGKPTTKSIFGPKTYFYIEQQYRQFGLFEPRLTGQVVTTFKFDTRNILIKVSQCHINDTVNIKYDYDFILIKGNKIPILEQLIGNVRNYYPVTSKTTK